MLNRNAIGIVLACIGIIIGSAQSARAQQTVNFTLGGFSPLHENARVGGDVLTANRTFLAFRLPDFDGVMVGGEWLIPVGGHLEAGAGVGFYQRTVPSVYSGSIDNSGNEIEQDLRLRIVPAALTFRLLPLGQPSGIQPYVGAGLGVFNWRYSEVGDFVNFDQVGHPVFPAGYFASGTETGPIALAGLRFAGETLSAGGEIRYQHAHANLDNRFAGSKLDLGGWTYQLTVGMRFGG